MSRPAAIALNPTQHHLDQLNRAVLLGVVLYFLMISYVLASCPNSENTPMGEVLCRVVDFMYGNLGRGLATLAVITLGVGALLGKVSWGMAVTVGVGIAVIFNAETITAMLLGCGTSNNFCN